MANSIVMVGPEGNREKVRVTDIEHYLDIGYKHCEPPIPGAEEPDQEGTDEEVIQAAEVQEADAADETPTEEDEAGDAKLTL